MAEGVPKPSFANVVRGEVTLDVTEENLEGPKPGTHRGKPALNFKGSRVASYAVPFKWALVGKFSQGRPKMEVINHFFLSLDLKADFKVGLLDSRHILINLTAEADFHRVFSRMVWNVERFPMRVFKWTSTFHVSRESPIVPIWVELPKLPIVFFNKEALFSIVSLIGQPLRMDAATISLKRPSVARVQVEIDLLKNMPDSVWIEVDGADGFWQPLVFETMPLYCSFCWHVGHAEHTCHVKHPELRVRQKVDRQEPDGVPKISNVVTQKKAWAEIKKTTKIGVAETKDVEGVSETRGETPMVATVPVGPVSSDTSKGKEVMECEGNDILDSQDQRDMSVTVFSEEKEGQLPCKGFPFGESSKQIFQHLVIEDEHLSPQQQTHEPKVSDDISADSQFLDNQGVSKGENKEELFQQIQKLLSPKEIENVVEEAITEAASELIEQIADRVVHENEEHILHTNTIQCEGIEKGETMTVDDIQPTKTDKADQQKVVNKIEENNSLNEEFHVLFYKITEYLPNGDEDQIFLEFFKGDDVVQQISVNKFRTEVEDMLSFRHCTTIDELHQQFKSMTDPQKNELLYKLDQDKEFVPVKSKKNRKKKDYPSSSKTLQTTQQSKNRQ